MSYERDNAFEEAALIAERWRDENRAAAAKARTRETRLAGLGMDHLPPRRSPAGQPGPSAKCRRGWRNPGMAEMLDGAAIECNAIAQAIRELKGSERAQRCAYRVPSLEERPY